MATSNSPLSPTGAAATAAGRYQWPDGKQAAVSLTYDDARLSQIDHGIPLLNSFGIRATFYVTIASMEKRIEGWKQAIRDGHEVGNHTVHHPCSCNFPWETPFVLENYTLERMETELVEANQVIQRLVGAVPKSFAYPCGQKYVGRGEETRSYVPLVAKHFLAGRGFCDEFCNNPSKCDLAQLLGVNGDRDSFDRLKVWIDQAVQHGGWLVFCGHEMMVEGQQAMARSSLEPLCRYLADPANGLWVDTVANIAAFIAQSRTP